MSSERMREKAKRRRQAIEQEKAHDKGTILGQVDGEKKAEKKELSEHKRGRLFKLIFSLFLVWVIGGSFLITTCVQLNADRNNVDTRWETYLESDPEVEQAALSVAEKSKATKVTVGSYLENLKELNVKDSYFRSVWIVWFMWEGNDELDFTDGGFIYYNGYINRAVVLKDEVTKDGIHYQQLRVDVTISQAFHTPRFPLENHILRSYIEPTYDLREVQFVASDDEDTVNSNINVYSYEIERVASGLKYYAYSDTHDDPLLKDSETPYLVEYMNEIEVNRMGWGLYVKCFIALWGTTLWVLIMLFVATRHRVDVFSMIPATLFGAVGNIMVGANLLPEALSLGLLEYGNIWGIFIVLAGTVTITIINRERNHWKDNDFADKYGRLMFFSILALAIIGNIALPLVSYSF